MNRKILSILIVLITVLSVSAVSAAEIDDASNDVMAISEDADMLAASHDIAAGSSADDIQAIIDNTSAGDTLNFANDIEYDLGNNSAINIVHTLILNGNNATIKGAQGFFIQADSESTDGFEAHNLNFIMVSETGYNGRALDIRSTNNIVVDGNAGIRVQRCTNTTITNNIFTGTYNESSIGTRNEEGTKAINLMGGSNHQIEGNYFGDGCLDGVSIASGAQSVNMIDNVFENNAYGIFYGGGVTNVNTTGNRYTNCSVYAIGLVKAAGQTIIEDNKFEIPEMASAIYIEQGNTAHDAPSNVEDILITGNDFSAVDETADDVSNAVYISTNNGPLAPVGEVEITGNTYNTNVAPLTVIQGNWDVDGNDVTIYPNSYETLISADNQGIYNPGQTFVIQLTTDDGKVIADQTLAISVTNDGELTDSVTLTTNNLGVVELELTDVGEYSVYVEFEGADVSGASYGESSNTFNFTVIPYGTVISGEDITIATRAKNRFEIVLKDENNKLLTNKTVQFTINGVTYNRTSDDNGVAGLNINLNLGKYNITAAYTDELGTVYNETFEITAIQSNTTILCDPVTFEGKGHAFTATLVDSLGQPIADAAVAFHINGVAYYRGTDANGQFSININLNPGIYNMYMSYDGTLQYGKSNGGSQVTII